MKLLEYAKRPEVYAKSSNKFWDDEHISKGMLEAHLNPNIEAATRNLNFIDKSVAWISSIAPSTKYTRLLDLGCGPGLYADRFSKYGYIVTGIDFSKRSIDYAKSKNNINLYLYENYLNIDYNNEFDIITLIYCDYGVLSKQERQILLKKIYKSLKPGGKFIVDVFTTNNYINDKENKKWYLNEGSGFWKPTTHLCLESHYIYENDIRLDQYIVIDNNNIDVYNIWDQAFTKISFIDEVKDIFNKFSFYSNVSGELYNEDSKTMCIILEK